MEPNQNDQYQSNQDVPLVSQEPVYIDESQEDKGYFTSSKLILGLLILLSIIFFSILAYSAKYYFDNMNKRPAVIQSVPVTNSSSSTPASSSAATTTPTTVSSSAAAPTTKPGNINSDSGLLIRKDDGGLKYPNTTGAVQGSFGDKESITIDTSKGKKEFVIGGEKLSFVYATGATKDGWVAEKFIVYK